MRSREKGGGLVGKAGGTIKEFASGTKGVDVQASRGLLWDVSKYCSGVVSQIISSSSEVIAIVESTLLLGDDISGVVVVVDESCSEGSIS